MRCLEKGPKNERCIRELIFWNMYLNIYIFERCNSDLVQAWHKSGRGIDEKFFFKDLLHNCFLTRQLLKGKHYQLSAAVSLIVVTVFLYLQLISVHLLCMIIRCIQRMKQAYIHVNIYSWELTLYVERSLACFAFIKEKEGFFSWKQVSVLSLFYQSATWKTNGRDLPNAGHWSFCRVSHLTSILDLGCVFFYGIKHTCRKKTKGTRW